ncbi:MAG TPA: carbohydrate kinase family protein [Solirubrobacteraceae bacterium]|nr:carbohydrate kinase family protein [Solirubrobacteraceae bacterium]
MQGADRKGLDPPTLTVIGGVQADVVMSPVTDLPSPGGTLLTDQMTVRVGGAGANAALASVEAGMDVRLIGCIGDDQLGAWMREQLAPAGLADELVVVAGDTSGLTVALESPARDRTFLTYLGVNAHWEASMIPDDALACENLLLCDYFVTPRLRADAARRLLDTARGHGARTFFDTTWDPDGFAAHSRAEVCDLLPSVDVFLPNEVEACALADRPGDAAQAARDLQAESGGWVVVKLGPSGCLAAGPDGTEIAVPAPAVTVADTTGAGDAFNAGLVGAVARGARWPEALATATEFATAIVARPSNDRYRIAVTEVEG